MQSDSDPSCSKLTTSINIDPSAGGTTQLDNSGGYNHFTDGFGNYRTYDNPNATPENQGENGSWTRMTEAP